MSYAPFHLQINNLCCQRGHKQLFHQLNFVLHNAQAVHIQGENGSGKSTLLNALAGFTQPAQGEILFNQKNILEYADEYHEHIAWLGHKNALNPARSTLDNLAFLLFLKGVHFHQDALIGHLNSWKLAEMAFLPVKQLSQGQKQKLALLSIFLARPVLWFLDEPLSALDSDSQALVQENITAHLQNGGCVIYSSHQPLLLDAQRHIQIADFANGENA